MSFDRYHEAVDYLERRLWHELPIIPVERALQQRIRRLLGHFGDPHLRFPVIHVGGSAGKGSTAAMIAAILRASGLRTGLYTSPHLQTFLERYDIDGRLMPPGTFADLVLGLDPLVREMHIRILDGDGFGRPSLVEVAFAAGMRWFADEGVDAAVVEVGLGGRTDCTNVFEDKPVTVITNIELEHTERLGTTRAAIAREKSALIRGHEAVVTGERHRDALDVIEARCDAMESELLRAAWRSARDGDGAEIDVKTPAGWLRGIRTGMTGAHQARNAAVAATAALAFAARTGTRVTEMAVRKGLQEARINGRMEVMQDVPRVILDGAHNPAEARALAAALRDAVPARGRLHLVCGILGDKDQAAMVRALAPVAASVVVTQPPLETRQGDPARTVALFEKQPGRRRVGFAREPEAALDLALGRARPADTVVVTGSMFLVGHVRGRWVSEAQILRRRSAARA